jgi:hypothetical protein
MSIDQLFQQAVALIGTGDVPALDRLLTGHPELTTTPYPPPDFPRYAGSSGTVPDELAALAVPPPAESHPGAAGGDPDQDKSVASVTLFFILPRGPILLVL